MPSWNLQSLSKFDICTLCMLQGSQSTYTLETKYYWAQIEKIHGWETKANYRDNQTWFSENVDKR